MRRKKGELMSALTRILKITKRAPEECEEEPPQDLLEKSHEETISSLRDLRERIRARPRRKRATAT
jgi:hypothetical protein